LDNPDQFLKSPDMGPFLNINPGRALEIDFWRFPVKLCGHFLTGEIIACPVLIGVLSLLVDFGYAKQLPAALPLPR